MKVKAISRQTLSRRTGDVHRVDRNPTPELHPFERAREYTRALNATKLERVFAKPFLGALDDHKDGVFSMATHPQTLSTIYSGACDGELKCWNLASRKQAWSVNAHRGFVRGIAPSRNGEIIVSCSNDKTVKLWRVSSAFADPNNVKPIKTILGSMPFMAIDHHWFDSSFATASTVVDIWDHQRDEAVQSFEWGADSIHCVRFNRTETNVLASCGSDRSITLYDVRLKSAIRKLVLQMSSNSIQWNPMEAFNFTANEDHNLYAFDMHKLDIARIIYKGHVGAVMCLDYAPTGREIVSGSYNHSVRIFAENEGSSREVRDRRQQVFIAVASYWIVSISLVFLNKFAMQDVNAPIFITWTQLVLAVIGCSTLSSLKSNVPQLSFFPHLVLSWGVAMRIVPFSLTFIGMITFSNLCLKHVNVSFYQTARSLTIIFIVTLTYTVMGTKISQKALLCVFAVFVGYVIGSSSELKLASLSLYGSVFGVLASLFVSLYAINVKNAMEHVGGNKWVLMWYNNLLASVLMPPLIIMFGEVPTLISSAEFYTHSFWFKCILLTGVFGFLINIATYAQIQATSPLTHNISGTAKAAVQTVIALLWLQESIALEGLLGLSLVLGGSLSYSFVRDQEMHILKGKGQYTAEQTKIASDVELGKDDDIN